MDRKIVRSGQIRQIFFWGFAYFILMIYVINKNWLQVVLTARYPKFRFRWSYAYYGEMWNILPENYGILQIK